MRLMMLRVGWASCEERPGPLGACVGNMEWNRSQNSEPLAGLCGIPSSTSLPHNFRRPAHPAPPLGTLLETLAA